MLTAGGPISFYPYAGVGRTSLKRSGFDKTLTTYNLGAGLGFSAVPKLTLDVRGELQAIVDGQTTRKFANATAGLSYSLFSIP
jgi:opacity protein-like surface antigen